MDNTLRDLFEAMNPTNPTIAHLVEAEKIILSSMLIRNTSPVDAKPSEEEYTDEGYEHPLGIYSEL